MTSSTFSDIDVLQASTTELPRGARELFNFLKRRRILVFTYREPFDENGYIFYIGTNGYEQPFENPSRSGKICITASTYHPASTYGDAHNLTTGKQNLFYTDYSPFEERWIKIDLKENKPIIPNSYSLNSCVLGGKYSLRNWLFQGSNDDKTWITLSEHENDNSLENNIDTPTAWRIIGESTPFRYFRLYTTKTQQNGTNFVSLGAFEIHGTIYL
jgi:hypothetical protein